MLTTWPVEGFEICSSPVAADLSGDDWFPAVIPGGVHESLVAAGRLADPYRNQHEYDAAPVQEKSWWYRATLHRPDVPADHQLVLEFAGVDTVATVFLDGRVVARHESQFRPLRLPVDDLPSSAELLIRFDPPLHGLSEPAGPRATRDRMRAYFEAQGALVGDEKPSGVMFGNLAMTLRRKALFSWGWDFAPALPSIGIIAPVTLRAEPDCRLDDVHWRTLDVDAATGRATGRIHIDTTGAPDDATVTWSLRAPDGTDVATGEFAAHEGTCDVAIDHARLWWTHDLGEPSLHELTVRLSVDGDVADERVRSVGIRTIELDRGDDDEGGRRFRFVLNGIPLFARGANWVPPSMLIGSVGDDRLRSLLTSARDAQMTMIRVWGGGRYEPDVFYDTCDRLGLLVWQDFMFACVDYPDTDESLRAEVAAEAEFHVTRLRAHPCIALWAGNNEASAMHNAIWGKEEPGGWGEYFYDELLPNTLARLAPGAVYWRASPHGELDSANGVLDGDRHAWEVWHGGDLGAGGPQDSDDPGEAVHFWRYRHDRGRFISEFGLHAAPELSTLQRWTDEPLSLDSPALLHRIKDTPKFKGMALLTTETGTPQTLRAYLAASMMVQAEGLTYGIAHYRRRQPICSGTLVWQLNEPWPGLSWSVLDYDGVPKAAWYALRRIYAPVIATLDHDRATGETSLWVTNSSAQRAVGVLHPRVRSFNGSIETQQVVEFDVAPAESVRVSTLPAPTDPRSSYAEVLDVSGRLPRQRVFFDHLKNLPLGGEVETDIRSAPGGRATVTVRARGFAYAVRVDLPAASVRVSDAYFDLADGDTATIEVTGLPDGFDAADLEVRTWVTDQRDAH